MKRILLCALTLLVSGCGSDTPTPPNFGSADGTEIAKVIEEFNEAKTDPKKIAEMFAAKPGADSKKYGKLMFELVDRPTINGNEATAKVAVLDDGTGNEQGTVTWAFLKDGSTWKIKDAPLP